MERNPNSDAAYFKIRDSLPKRRAEAYELVYRFGPATAAEIVSRANLHSHGGRGMAGNLHARLNELVEQDVVSVTQTRICAITGHDVMEFDITGRGPNGPVKRANVGGFSKSSLKRMRQLWERYPEHRSAIGEVMDLARRDIENGTKNGRR
jgi:hypothetical protein